MDFSSTCNPLLPHPVEMRSASSPSSFWPLLIWPTQGSIVVRIHATTGIPLISTRAVVRTALQLLILLTLINDTVVRAGVELSKFHCHWLDQLLRPIGIDGHLVILWVCGSKDT